MRLCDQVIGVLNLFRAARRAFDPANVRIGQALADVATIIKAVRPRHALQ